MEAGKEVGVVGLGAEGQGRGRGTHTCALPPAAQKEFVDFLEAADLAELPGKQPKCQDPAEKQ